MSPHFVRASEGSALPVLEVLRARVSASAHLRLDSRELSPGDVFIACRGVQGDGRAYIGSALDAGAAVVLYDSDALTQSVVADSRVLPVAGLRGMLGELADGWYGQPSASLTVLAVTGTNGKTSCVQWLARALTRLGKPCGTIGTLGGLLPDGVSLGGNLTTPDVITLHRLMAQMRDAGAQAVAIEASSIGLEQGRMDSVRLIAAGYTNLTRDHLDYHGTMEQYEAAKALLFNWPGLQAAVINADDAAGRRLLAKLPVGLASAYAIDHAEADVRAFDLQATAHGQVFTLATSEGQAQVVTGLLGHHNVSNLLLVAGLLLRLGWPLAAVAREVAAAAPVDGRLQAVAPVGSAQGPLVVVDYAHTPDALERALLALRPVAQARNGALVCLFGCGGDRDPGKRPEMGRIAGELADRIIVSSDNPRSEAPQAIIDQVLAGVGPDLALRAESDRALAILHAIWDSWPEDVVLLAGKGHETYQEIAGRRLAFDDREWARAALLLPHVAGVSTDTRSVAADEIFVAISGENFDGHRYLAQAQAAGACAAVVAHRVSDSSLPQLVLGETRHALGRLATAWRARFSLPVIAVTGSNGKTTTKEMISAILAAWQGEAHRLATSGNFNNDIGLPLTLLRLREGYRAAVVELGMNHPGEIAYLAPMAQASVALVNNAQREHQEFLHGVEAVARENGAVLSALPEDGVAVYPGDDVYTPIWDELAGARRVLRFGLQPGLDVYAQKIRPDASGTLCQVVTPMGVADIVLPVPGEHNLRNALAAIACALAAGAPLASAVRALEGFSAVKGRMQRKETSNGTILIDDTYNANPDSVRVAIEVLAQLPGPRVLVLGDMGEVGDEGPAMHREVGGYARDQGIDAMVTLGDASRAAAAEFGAGAHACASVDEVLAALRGMNPFSVLIKGSRFMRMERVVTAFSASGDEAASGQEDKHVA
ncbi:bifunctional UDP-N-acetylmuramoyl-L-alanyl-D-glutamate--2,6-diaminopimelate ligase MurE/UDP-N-acetylmuramoyl-tripeptide--D-alanyl-D-alanine ligase MurF [Bordetella avium]|uniref:Multifunctional fusion protein n=1 Tax=Bordetella avium (strain 197N) TaxID=360910 RepID=Q2KVF1_BORA1|nr:bifunctional UDP-N-acetylmuramoyl-L-alanyl-D-glutamate--2,6-diaminopimelate ligase MurE/UDP-N-acetylmuramoyl-tripeptide--D-alanyl-D-alanine ligase MurF [Bordetella avium]RIQ48039.1 bifunctional UDP-N-acetylmuramoyl-L-alanyl-D-glutamate--2,6-diaminopimelate ligase MurE/UDP-N-acetylmuramoyl-tripeptide--D-alanyl-D-alanine ligase MurF [Bordetella avium]RIQ73701.1 bifunctional UDP-N-acetylmuramoyl-L-alanyl-D-glutamate--2,6-diaminopimelate ligase MurE/UDP-N-acetylmuramoyl-tripeptide--D-alanyl-D-alan